MKYFILCSNYFNLSDFRKSVIFTFQSRGYLVVVNRGENASKMPKMSRILLQNRNFSPTIIEISNSTVLFVSGYILLLWMKRLGLTIVWDDLRTTNLVFSWVCNRCRDWNLISARYISFWYKLRIHMHTTSKSSIIDISRSGKMLSSYSSFLTESSTEIIFI